MGSFRPRLQPVALLRGASLQTGRRRRFGTVHDVAESTGVPLLERTVEARGPRHDWTKNEIAELYATPLFELQYAAVCITPI